MPLKYPPDVIRKGEDSRPTKHRLTNAPSRGIHLNSQTRHLNPDLQCLPIFLGFWRFFGGKVVVR